MRRRITWGGQREKINNFLDRKIFFFTIFMEILLQGWQRALFSPISVNVYFSPLPSSSSFNISLRYQNLWGFISDFIHPSICARWAYVERVKNYECLAWLRRSPFEGERSDKNISHVRKFDFYSIRLDLWRRCLDSDKLNPKLLRSS